MCITIHLTFECFKIPPNILKTNNRTMDAVPTLWTWWSLLKKKTDICNLLFFWQISFFKFFLIFHLIFFNFYFMFRFLYFILILERFSFGTMIWGLDRKFSKLLFFFAFHVFLIFYFVLFAFSNSGFFKLRIKVLASFLIYDHLIFLIFWFLNIWFFNFKLPWP